MRAAVASVAGSTDRLTLRGADLTRDEGLGRGGRGLRPRPARRLAARRRRTRDPDALSPARDGTLRVLRAATKAGVKRVVMTSAAAAARPPARHEPGQRRDDLGGPGPIREFDAYRRSKILAERAAWDFIAAKAGTTALTTILPGRRVRPRADDRATSDRCRSSSDC